MAEEQIFLDKTGFAKLWEIMKRHLSGKAEATHTHSKSEISDFPTALKNPNSLTIKANGLTYQTYNGGTAVTADISAGLIGAAVEGHKHVSADIEDLTTTLNNKASKIHAHAISDVSDLQTVLDAKANSIHSHTLSAKDITVTPSAWVSSTTYTKYPYQATISIKGATKQMVPYVAFGLEEAESGNFAPVYHATTDGVIIYAKTAPTAYVNILAVICHILEE